MKTKFLFLICALLFIYSCKNDDEISNTDEEIGLKKINVNVILPIGSTINPNDLIVSTILTENADVNNSTANVETFDDEAIELTFATNSSGNMVLLGYFDPKNINDFTINTETTAISLVLMHPWTSDLSVSAKKEAMNYIKNLPEFTSLKNSVEQSIISGNLDPLSSTTIIDKIVNIQNTHFNKLDVYKTPLQFNIDNSKIKIQNIQSSAAYSVGVYNPSNQLVEYKLVKGLGKTRSILNDLFTNTFLFTQSPATEFNTPTNNGTYYLKAKNGLSFDNSNENLQAAYENSKTLLADIIGIFSTTIQKLLKGKLSECSQSIGSFVYNGTSGTLKISESLQAYSQGTKSGYLLTKDLISFVSKRYDAVIGIIKNCSSNVYNLKESPLKSIFKYIDIITKAENAFNSGALVADWIQFDKTIETCFSKNGNDVNNCISIVGTWKHISTYWCGICISCIPEGQTVMGNCGGSYNGNPLCNWQYSLTFNENLTGIHSAVCNNPSKNFTYTINNTQTTLSVNYSNEPIQNFEILELSSTTLKIKELNYSDPDILTFQRQ